MPFRRKCPTCEKSFDARHYQKYCSVTCANRRHRPPGNPCEWCDKWVPIEIVNGRKRPHKFCCDDHRIQAMRQRNAKPIPFAVATVLDLITTHPAHAETKEFGGRKRADGWWEMEPKHITLAHRLQVAGMPPQTAYRLARRDYIGLHEADQIACLLGYHPAEVWGPEWYSKEKEILGDDDEENLPKNSASRDEPICLDLT